MLTASIHEDCFFIASVARRTAMELCPAPLRPVLTDGIGWISLAAVRLSDVRLFGCPVADAATCAAFLLLAEHHDGSGRATRGNYFVRSFTTSRRLAWATRFLGAGAFEHCDVLLTREHDSIAVGVADRFRARLRLDRPLAEQTQAHMERLFDGNQCGFVRATGRIWHLPLEKSHWAIRGCEADIERPDLLNGTGAVFRFAFDTSGARAHWRLPRPIPRPRSSIRVRVEDREPAPAAGPAEARALRAGTED